MKVIVVGVPGDNLKHYVFTAHIVRVKEISATTCMILMTDGAKYSFEKPALELVNLIDEAENEALEKFLNAEPGTDIVQ